MIANNAALFKWTLYGLAASLFLILQGVLLHRFHVWGVIPFLYPLLAAIPATYEGPASGMGFALALGVFCDLLLPEHFPCFYTLTFPLTGLFSSLLSLYLLPAGPLCSYAVSAAAFLFHGLFHCLILAAGGHAAWRAGLFLTLREFLVTVPLAAPLMTLLFLLVANRTRAGKHPHG